MIYKEKFFGVNRLSFSLVVKFWTYLKTVGESKDTY